MKRTETIQTAIETRAKINLVNDLDSLNKVFNSNRPLLAGVNVHLPEQPKTNTNLSHIFFKDSYIRTAIFDANIERYVQAETDKLLKNVDETQRDLGQLREVIAKELEEVSKSIVPSMKAEELDRLCQKINRVIVKIYGDE